MRALSRRLLTVAVALLCCTPLATPARAADDSRIDRLLRAVDVVATEPYQPGYDRDCDPGACVFGEAWIDEHDGPFGRNGCDPQRRPGP